MNIELYDFEKNLINNENEIVSVSLTDEEINKKEYISKPSIVGR